MPCNVQQLQNQHHDQHCDISHRNIINAYVQHYEHTDIDDIDDTDFFEHEHDDILQWGCSSEL